MQESYERWTIYCCECKGKVLARLTNGSEIYPHRQDLHDLPFWKCDACKNYVGCHHKTENRTHPLGNIPNAEMRKARQHIHAILDPLWKDGKFSRGEIYRMIGEKTGKKYHTAQIRTIEEARAVYLVIKGIQNENR